MPFKKITLIIAVLAVMSSTPTFAMNPSPLVGTWNSVGMRNNVFISIFLTINGDKTGVYNLYAAGNLVRTTPFRWTMDGDTICEYFPDGTSGCGTVALMVGGAQMTITLIDADPQKNGQVTSYSRQQVSFTGTRRCCECSCSGWIDGGKNGTCARKGCGHTYAEHARADGCPGE
jgi:hypothetical protein